MRSLTFVEIDLPVCSLTYGVAPCTAELGVTGDAPCFNSINSCQAREAFAETTTVLRFAIEADYLAESGIDAIPSITSVGHDPSIISLGENLGQRASVNISFKDHRWSDTGPGYDPYVSERPYDPYKQGTYWGKFRARQPFLRGRGLRLIRGYLGQTLEEMETRHYVIESTDGPTAKGIFSIVAKDPLKLADGDRAQAPALSNGFLVSGISAAATSATLTPAGIGDEEYPSSGYAAIGGKEIVAFTRTGDVLDLTGGRAQFGTDAVEHDTQDRVQVCLYYEAEDPADIIADLLESYADVDPEWLPVSSWLDETETFLRQVYTGVIAEPTSVHDLVSELSQQAALAIWWDEVNQEVRLQVLRQIATDAARWDDTSILEGSLSLKEQPKKRKSRVWVYYGQVNPLEGQDDPSNYRSAAVTIDTDAEEDNGSPAHDKIYSRWIPAFGRSIATRLGDIRLGRYSRAPRRFNYELFGTERPELGVGYQLEAWPLQDGTGARELVPIQITSLVHEADRWKVEAEEMRGIVFEEADLANRVITIDGNAYNLNLRDIHDTLYPDLREGDSVRFVINSNVRIGSVSTGLPAVDVGDWPSIAGNGTRTSASAVISGLTDTSAMAEGMFVTGAGIPSGTTIESVDSATEITLSANATSSGTSAVTVWTITPTVQMNGRIQGAGGKGGKGRGGDNNTGGSGGSGGRALYSRVPFTLTGAGRIYGGGGGGGGGGGDYRGLFGPQQNGGGGGGGAGDVAGGGGSGEHKNGNAGSLDSGGSGGSSNYSNFRGGHGGGPGSGGGNAVGDFAGSGGNGGRAVDGWSYVTEDEASMDYKGGNVN